MGLISLTWKTKITQPIRALTSISQLVSHWRAWESRRRDLEILAQDDGMPSDIGLSRSDVLAACNQPFWRNPRKWLAARAGSAKPPSALARQNRKKSAVAGFGSCGS
jgi:uncharacterized protein YjiS (DUF1127 family)